MDKIKKFESLQREQLKQNILKENKLAKKRLTNWAIFCMIAFPFSIFGVVIGKVINFEVMQFGYMFMLGWEFTVIIYELKISKHIPIKRFAKRGAD